MEDYFQRLVTQKSIELKIEVCPVNAGLTRLTVYTHCFSFATILAATFGCDQFRQHTTASSLLMEQHQTSQALAGHTKQSVLQHIFKTKTSLDGLLNEIYN